MMRQAVIPFLIVCVFAFLADNNPAQAQPPNFNPDRPNPNYTLVQVSGGAVLSNKLSGDSWWLFVEPGAKGKKPKATWLPITRVEDYSAVAKWIRSNRRSATEPVLDLEIAFAKKKLKEAKSQYGTRHPEVLAIAQDLRDLLKEQELIDKRRALVKKLKKKKSAEEAKANQDDDDDDDDDSDK